MKQINRKDQHVNLQLSAKKVHLQYSYFFGYHNVQFSFNQVTC